MLQIPIFWICDVANAEQSLNFFPAVIGDGDVAVLFINYKITREYLGLARSGVLLLAFFELGNDAVHFVILVGRLLAGARDDQWRTGFIDQDGVDFVHNRKVVPTLHAIF